MKTYSAKPGEVSVVWYEVDAKGQTLGRFATQIARLLTGKDKPQYTPSMVCGDMVVVINAKDIVVTGQKMTDKYYYHHTGMPGGIKDISLREQLEKDPTQVIKNAVKGMLPKNKLQAVMMNNLKVYAGNEHPHTAQKPVKWEVTNG